MREIFLPSFAIKNLCQVKSHFTVLLEQRCVTSRTDGYEKNKTLGGEGGGLYFWTSCGQETDELLRICIKFVLPNAFLRKAVTATSPVSLFYKGSPGNLSPINVKRMLSKMALKTTQACELKA